MIAADGGSLAQENITALRAATKPKRQTMAMKHEGMIRKSGYRFSE
jgi:hypothetical protein